jgi:hypothetical protein
MTTKFDDLIKELNLLATQFRTNDEYTALKNIQDVLTNITSDPDILINCDLPILININTAMYECQTKEDWLGLADYLEYDLIRAINPKTESSSI